jgi:hypothetical protein
MNSNAYQIRIGHDSNRIAGSIAIGLVVLEALVLELEARMNLAKASKKMSTSFELDFHSPLASYYVIDLEVLILTMFQIRIPKRMRVVDRWIYTRSTSKAGSWDFVPFLSCRVDELPSTLVCILKIDCMLHARGDLLVRINIA